MNYYLILISLFISTNLYTASFDCDNARSKIEKKICSSKTLNRLDSLVGWQYVFFTKEPKAFYLKHRVRKEQRLWLKKRNKECSSLPDNLLEKCLISSYEERLKKLQLLEKQTSQSFAIIDNKKCSKVNIVNKTFINLKGDTCDKYNYLDKTTRDNLLSSNQHIPALFLDQNISQIPSQNKNCDDYSYYTSYKENIVYINPIVISFQYERSSYSGGSHGDGENYYINYNRQTGETLTWETLFKNNTKFNEYVKNRIKNELLREGYIDARYLNTTLEAFKTTGYFSIRSDALYIEYGLYELAPYSAGFQSLNISKKILKRYMKKSLYNLYFINNGTVYLNTSCPQW